MKTKKKRDAEDSMEDDGEWLPAQHEDFTDDAVRDAVEESDVDDEIDSENVSNRLARWRNVKVGQELGARRAALGTRVLQAPFSF